MTTLTDCPSFIDLRVLAEQATLHAGTDPFGADAQILPVRAGPCEIFVATVAGAGKAREDRGDTWIFVPDASIIIEHDGKNSTIEPGSSAVVARGTEFGWQGPENGHALIIGMRYLDAEAGNGGVFPIDNAAPLSPSNPPADNVLLSGRPNCRSNNVFRSKSGEFQCGTWDSTPYQRIPIFFAHSELMHLLQGEVTFTDEAGRTATFRKGDTFIIEQGARCSWDSHERVAKIYAQYCPAQ